MLIGYARISKADGSQSLDLQRDALREAGVSDDALYEDQASGQREDRPGLAAVLKAARQGDVIVVWRLDRLGRNLRHLVNLVQDLNDRDIGIILLDWLMFEYQPGEIWLSRSPRGGSILVTVAPISASRDAANGPGKAVLKSTALVFR